MKLKKIAIITLLAVCATLIAALSLQPLLIKAILAKYKSTDHFLTLEEDPRIRYEELAKENALHTAQFLSKSKEQVEKILRAPFKEEITVYICATQESFNEYVFLSKNVRGAVFWEKFFLSPRAFSVGSPSRLTAHELTHYFFNSYLGEKKHLKNIPLWFREGIAVFVANGGTSYTVNSNVLERTSDEERSTILSGSIDFWFTSNDPRDAVTKAGVANWMLYRAAALFVHYLHDTQPNKFNKLIERLISGESFETAIDNQYGKDQQSLLEDFTKYLETSQ